MAVLRSIHIENIAVIKKLDIDLFDGFTVLTGETGAGKSIIMDSVNLLTGGKFSKELIRTGEDYAYVCALFTDINEELVSELTQYDVLPDENGELYLERRVTSDGRQTAKINSKSVPVSILREAGKRLIAIHGQNDNQLLLTQSIHQVYLDEYACVNDTSFLRIKDEYLTYYGKYREIQKKLDDVRIDAGEKEILTDTLKAQIVEIESAKLKEDEESLLTEKRDKLKNIGALAKQGKIIYRALYQNEKGVSCYQLLEYAENALARLEGLVEGAADYKARIENARFDFEAIATAVKDAVDIGDEDPEKQLTAIESRLDKISRLKKKYGSCIAEIKAYGEKIKERLSYIEKQELIEKELTAELEEIKKLLSESALKLRNKRKSAAKQVEKEITAELRFVDMEKAQFSVSVEEDEYSSNGGDRIEFMISANVGEPLKPLIKIASGGELSRVVLALKSVISTKKDTYTMVFDEVDTGTSGKTAQKIGILLKKISKSAQVICITHSAQIAALAKNHYYISKRETEGRTQTSLKLLTYEERVSEVARIMGGVEITDSIVNSAREAIELAEKE